MKVYIAQARRASAPVPMIAYSGGYFLASWKNGVLSEDTPGQRVLWAYATESEPLAYSAPAVLFPNVSSGAPCPPSSHVPYPPSPHYLSPACAHLFAEPTVVLHGRVYFAASLRQFCLWPLDPLNQGGRFLLLRRVLLGATPQLGPIFWAKDPGDAWAATNRRLGIRTLSEMDSSTRGDVVALLAGERPCAPNAAAKCEYC